MCKSIQYKLPGAQFYRSQTVDKDAMADIWSVRATRFLQMLDSRLQLS